jgi:hypothetical protein
MTFSAEFKSFSSKPGALEAVNLRDSRITSALSIVSLEAEEDWGAWVEVVTMRAVEITQNDTARTKSIKTAS